jgi:hypothetical protein
MDVIGLLLELLRFAFAPPDPCLIKSRRLHPEGAVVVTNLTN